MFEENYIPVTFRKRDSMSHGVVCKLWESLVTVETAEDADFVDVSERARPLAITVHQRSECEYVTYWRHNQYSMYIAATC